MKEIKFYGPKWIEADISGGRLKNNSPSLKRRHSKHCVFSTSSGSRGNPVDQPQKWLWPDPNSPPNSHQTISITMPKTSITDLGSWFCFLKMMRDMVQVQLLCLGLLEQYQKMAWLVWCGVSLVERLGKRK